MGTEKKKYIFLIGMAMLILLPSLSTACSATNSEEPEEQSGGDSSSSSGGDSSSEEEEIPDGPTVELPAPYGFLRGKIKETVGYSGREKKKYAVYRSIPYAKPITQNNRFAQPEALSPTDPSLGTEDSPFDATKTGPLCPQGETNPKMITDFMDMGIQEALDLVMNSFTDKSHMPFPISQRDTISLLEKLFNIQHLNIRDKTLYETIKAWLDVDFGMSEDCLHLTVSTPDKEPPEDGFPVMFFVHGGGFSSGTHLHSEADRLGDVADVVVVAVNYRVGILGFLCLDSEESAGNQGMLDVVLALEWVQHYISKFGGDPSRVTIFGESAGSATIGHLLLSPELKDKKLFQYGIGQSGSAISPWAFDREPRKSAYEFAERMKCNATLGDDSIVHCLRRFQSWELAREFNKMTADRRKNLDLGFGGTSPCAQTKGKRKFYGPKDDPSELLYTQEYNTDIPILFGANLFEGIYGYNLVYNAFLKPNGYHKLFNKEAKEYREYQFLDDINKAISFDKGYGLKNIIKDNYFGKKTDMSNLKKTTAGYIDYIGMHILKASSYEMMSKHVENGGKAYWYSFEYAGQKSICHILAMLTEAPDVGDYGACHGDELLFMFDYELPIVMCDINELIQYAVLSYATCSGDIECIVDELRKNKSECLEGRLTDVEKKVADTVAKVWTNFAATGDPNGVGIPAMILWDQEKESYLVIDEESSIDAKYEKKYITSART